MATIGPISITGSWTKIYDGRESGAFNGGIQALDANAVYVRVTDTGNAPTNNGGFMLVNEIYPFGVSATQVAWARAADGAGQIVLG